MPALGSSVVWSSVAACASVTSCSPVAFLLFSGCLRRPRGPQSRLHTIAPCRIVWVQRPGHPLLLHCLCVRRKGCRQAKQLPWWMRSRRQRRPTPRARLRTSAQSWCRASISLPPSRLLPRTLGGCWGWMCGEGPHFWWARGASRVAAQAGGALGGCTGGGPAYDVSSAQAGGALLVGKGRLLGWCAGKGCAWVG